MSSILPDIVKDPDIKLDTDEEIEMEIEEEPSPEPIVRENLSKEEVFEKPKKPKKNVLIDPIPQEGPEIEQIVNPTKKQRKPRKPMSDEQKAKLAEARKKGLETRKRNAAERKKIKELEDKAVKKMKENKQRELERIVDDKPEEPVKAEIDQTIIQKAIDDAIIKHETLRQQRKAAKKAAIAEEVQKKKVEEQIKAALYPPKKYFGDSGFASQHIFNFQ